MNNEQLHTIMHENMQIVDKLTTLIQQLQIIGQEYAFFAIEAQENLMKCHAMLLGKKKGF